MSAQAHGVRTAALAAAGVAVLAAISWALAGYANGIAPYWLANALIVAALIRFPALDVKLAAAGAATGTMLAALAMGIDPRTAAIITGANAIEVVAAPALFRLFGRRSHTSRTLSDLGAFVAGPVVAVPLVSSVVAAGGLAITTGAPFAPLASQWFAANALGMLLMGPLVLLLGWRDCRSVLMSPRVIEVAGLLAITAAATFAVFQQPRYPVLFVIIPLLVLAAFRFRLIGAAVGVAAVAVIASVETLSGGGPIANALPDSTDRILFLQAFLAVTAGTGIPLAAVLVDRDELAKRIALSEEQYRLLADQSNDLIVRIGIDGVRRYISPSSRAILGFEPSDLLGKSALSAIHSEDRARVEAVCRTLLDGAVNPGCTYRQRRRDGSYVLLEATYRLLRDVEGHPSEVLASVRDISARKRAELSLLTAAAQREESHRLLSMAEGLAGVGHWRLDAVHRDLFWSTEVFRIHGRAVGDLPTLEEGIEAYHPDDRAIVRGHVEQALSAGRSWSFRARLIRLDGEVRHVASSGQAERAPDGSINGVFGVFRDVTDEVTAEEALIAARDEARALMEAKSAFLATMSHEIRTPMTGVLGMIELLRTDLTPKDRERFFYNLEQSANLLMTVLDDVLDFSKIESNNLVLEHVDFSLAEVARNTADLFHHAASKKGLLLSVAVENEADTVVRGDPVRLQQVISNLVSNAVKFTATGRIELHLAVTPEGRRRRVRIAVIDTGIGIAAETAKALFEPFFQGDVSTTRRFGGTGLGLAICKRLVEAMHGKIDVSSTEGQGTTFSVELMLDAGVIKDRLRRPAVAQASRPLSVLLAEDNQINRALVESLVRRGGHTIHSVENGALAVEAAEAEAYDVILMDMQMPEMDGLAATRAIRSGTGPCAGIPIIALTADASAERRRFYENVGLTEFLTKPIDTALLIERLQMIAVGSVGAPMPETVAVSSDLLLDHDHLDLLEAEIGYANLHRLLEMLDGELSVRPLMIQRMIALGLDQAVLMESHSLKGAALNVGAARVGQLARLIEDACKAGEPLESLGQALIDAAHATRVDLDRREKRRRSA